MTIKQSFALFLDDQYLKGNSLNTITDYSNMLRGFLNSYGDMLLTDLNS